MKLLIIEFPPPPGEYCDVYRILCAAVNKIFRLTGIDEFNAPPCLSAHASLVAVTVYNVNVHAAIRPVY